MQQKTQRPVQFKVTDQTRDSTSAWIMHAHFRAGDFLVSSRIHESPHPWTRRYARIIDGWVSPIGLDLNAYGTHTMRCTEPTLTYKRTKNLLAVQLLLGVAQLGSSVRYLAIEVDDTLEISEQTAL